MTEIPSDTATVVMVEGESDRSALQVLAERQGRNLPTEGVAIVAMHGATNIGHFLRRFGPAGLDLRLAGLCDEAEIGYFERGLQQVGLAVGTDAVHLERHGFFVCRADLEDELMRARGVDGMLSFIAAQGELGAFETFRKQPAQHDRSINAQLRRFVGTRSGRKKRYATGLIGELDLHLVPAPLDALLDHI